MNLLFRLLDPKVARAFYDWMMGLSVFAKIFVGDANLDRFQTWLWGTASGASGKVHRRSTTPP
jgi:hypothetical protein